MHPMILCSEVKFLKRERERERQADWDHVRATSWEGERNDAVKRREEVQVKRKREKERVNDGKIKRELETGRKLKINSRG